MKADIIQYKGTSVRKDDAKPDERFGDISFDRTSRSTFGDR